jgi:hypothetical protein
MDEIDKRGNMKIEGLPLSYGFILRLGGKGDELRMN